MLGINFYKGNIDDLCNEIITNINNRKQFYCTTVNVDIYLLMEENLILKEIVNKSQYIVADGMPLVWLSKIKKEPVNRITGADLMPKLCDIAAKNYFRIFLLGGTEKVNFKAQEVIERKYGKIVAGRYSPPIGFEKDEKELAAIINIINSCRPDIVFACLGAPKQEFWISENLHKTNASFALTAGAGIDFISGNMKRAPLLLQNMGLEWLYRLLMEPKRLYKRYIIRDSKFIIMAIKELFIKNAS